MLRLTRPLHLRNNVMSGIRITRGMFDTDIMARPFLFVTLLRKGVKLTQLSSSSSISSSSSSSSSSSKFSSSFHLLPLVLLRETLLFLLLLIDFNKGDNPGACTMSVHGEPR